MNDQWREKFIFLATKLISENGKALGTRLNFNKIEKNPHQQTLLWNPESGDGANEPPF